MISLLGGRAVRRHPVAARPRRQAGAALVRGRQAGHVLVAPAGRQQGDAKGEHCRGAVTAAGRAMR